MSRIGKKEIKIPTGVTVEINGNTVKVKGPKGELVQDFRSEVSIAQKDGVLNCVLEDSSLKDGNALWGLTRALLANMILGVTEGFEKRLELVGVGYRTKTEGKGISLSVGYSNPVQFDPPEGISLQVEDNKNIIVTGIDKQLVGQVAAKIREVRKPEPYKGKGIRYVGEEIMRKAGKAGKK